MNDRYRDIRDRLMSSAILRALNVADREDLVHNAIVRVLTRFPLLDPDQQERVAFATVRFELRDERRRRSRRHAEPLADAEHRASQRSPSDLAEDAERLLLLRRALADALTPRQRTILHLHFAERQSYRAIADRLGMSETGVRRELFLTLDLVRAVVGSSDG